MGADTKIEWAHHSFNPWYGCQKVGPGCDNCYAEGWAKRSGLVQWGVGADRRRSSAANWRKPLKWNAEAERLGIRYRVFCASLADVFDNAVPAEWRRDLFDLIEITPHLDWLLATKRIGNVERMIPDRWSVALPLNVWLGITVTDQAEADRDIPKLLAVKTLGVRFLSIEPLLGPVELDCVDRPPNWKQPIDECDDGIDPLRYRSARGEQRGIDWVIVGGESGPHARPMHPDWVRSLRDQCAAAGVPFLFKQWGEWLPAGQDGNPEHDPFEINASDSPVRIGKAAAGRLLDGALHDEYPKVLT